MIRQHALAAGQVGDGAGHAQDAVVGAGAEAQVFHRGFHQALTIGIRRGVFAQLAAGHSAILDAVFGQPAERAEAEASAAALGVRFHGLFLEAPLATRLARVGGRSRDASDADAAVVRAQERYDLGPLQWTLIDASGTPADTLRQARAQVP